MPADVVGDIQRVTVAVMQPDSQVQECNICFRCSVTAGADTRGQLGLLVYGKFKANWLPVMAPASRLYGWKVSSVNKVPSQQPVWNVVVGDIGTSTDPVAPTQARPIQRFSTASAGRKYRGRIFLPTPSASQLANTGFPLAAMIAASQALGVALIANVVSGGTTWVPVIAHRVPHLPASTTTTDMLGTNSSGLFGTQRRSGNTGRMNPPPW